MAPRTGRAKKKQLITVFHEAMSTECDQTESSNADEGMRHTNGRARSGTSDSCIPPWRYWALSRGNTIELVLQLAFYCKSVRTVALSQSVCVANNDR